MENSAEEQKILDNIKENSDMAFVEEGLKDNSYEFEHAGAKYRVVKPSGKEKQIIYEKEAQKFVELLQDNKYMLEEQLKRLLKEKGVDIDAMNKKMKQFEQQKNNLMMALGQMIKDNGSESDQNKLKDEILSILEEQQLLVIKKTKMLTYSIENQINIFSYSYLTYLIAQKLVEDKWVPAFKSYEDMTNFEDETLINNFTVRAVLVGREEIENVSR